MLRDPSSETTAKEESSHIKNNNAHIGLFVDRFHVNDIMLNHSYIILEGTNKWFYQAFDFCFYVYQLEALQP